MLNNTIFKFNNIESTIDSTSSYISEDSISFAVSSMPNFYAHTDVTLEEQNRLDTLIAMNFNIIPNNFAYETLKEYENKYQMVSEKFYTRWQKGLEQHNIEIHNWMNIYKTLYKV